MKILKLISINVIVFFAFIFILNIISIIIFKSYNSIIDHSDTRAQLPNYKNIKWSEQHFKELSELSAEYRSYIGWRMLPYAGKTINVKKDGIRITPQHPNVNNNSLEVLFLGGSTTWGVGADNYNTIPALFSQLGEGKYNTINFGEHSYRAYQSFLFFNSKVNDGLKPDIVISYDGVNEKVGFLENHSPDSHSRENQIRALVKGQDRNKDEREMMSFKRFFTGPLMVLLSRLKGNRNPETTDNSISTKKSDAVAKAMLDAWLNTKRLAEGNGALFFCVLQPNALIGSPNLDHLKINPERIKVYTKLYESVIKKMATPAYNSLQNNFIDLRYVLDGNEKYYIDFCHLSPNGNRIVAQQLFQEINNRRKDLEDGTQ